MVEGGENKFASQRNAAEVERVALIERLRPSVVTIGVIKEMSDIDPLTGEHRSRPEKVWSGSGFFISKNRILTNQHVAGYEGVEFRVVLSSGKAVSARVVYVDKSPDPVRDIAVLEIDSSEGDFTPVVMGNSDIVRQGEDVLPIGSPLGIRGIPSTGIIARPPLEPLPHDSETDSENKRFIEFTAPIHPGSSGGPLFNSTGEVIGMNTATLADTRNFSGSINFAIPEKEFRALVKYTDTFIRIGNAFKEIKKSRGEDDMRLGDAVAKVITDIRKAIEATVPAEGREEAKRIILSDQGIVSRFQDLIGRARANREAYIAKWQELGGGPVPETKKKIEQE